MAKAYSYIRFSSKQQAKGDSLRRQLASAKEYAESNGFELDTSLTLQDLGVSAFRGQNYDTGALGEFLKLVELGTVPQGSFLLIESLDRLSRDVISTALPKFLEILNAGVNIVTLVDGQTYTRETINESSGQLFISLSYMLRAHDESRMKSERISKANAAKREKARSGWATPKKTHGWLRFVGDKVSGRFEVIPEKVEIVRRAFEEYLKGKGPHTIAKELNEDGIVPFGRARQWSSTYIGLLLKNRAVIGEYQPTVKANASDNAFAKYVEDGPPVIDYYPAVVEQETFYAVQTRLETQRSPRGNAGKTYRNIFTGLLRCRNCGSSVQLRVSGDGHSYHYLRCYKRIQGSGCDLINWKYFDVQSAILLGLRHLEFRPLLVEKDELSRAYREVETKVSSLQSKKTELERQYDNITDLYAQSPSDRLARQLRDREAQLDELESSLAAKKKRLNELEDQISNQNQTAKELSDNVEALLAGVGDSNANGKAFREALNYSLRSVIERIELMSVGEWRQVYVTFKSGNGILFKQKAYGHWHFAERSATRMEAIQFELSPAGVPENWTIWQWKAEEGISNLVSEMADLAASELIFRLAGSRLEV